MLQKEIDKLYREKKLQKREHDRDLAQKNTKINNLLTELENTKTDLEYFQKAKNKVAKEKEELEEQVHKVKKESREQIIQYD